MKRHLGAVVLTALIAGAVGIATAQDQIYVTEYKFEDPALRAMDLDGSNVDDLFEPGNAIPSSDWLTVGLALDEDAGHIYWMHGSTPGRVRRADLDGNNQTQLVSGLKIPRGLALDLENGKMYWAAAPPAGNAGGMIQRANLDGSSVETVYLDPDYDAVSSKIGPPSVDSVNGWVYFATNDRIVRTHLAGPPFEIHTVVTGVSTARAVALDTANGHIYWIGADTIEDVVCRANLDNTEFTIVYDLSPNSGNSSGLGDIVLDLAGGTFFVCDDIRDQVDRGETDGSALETIYTAPSGFSPSAMALNVNLTQALTDCNGNGIPDSQDLLDLTSDDCNQNGIPDECEDDPCAVPDYLVDQSQNITNPGRQLGGAPQNQRWMVFQPFDVPAGGWEIGGIRLNGVTWTYRPEGFTTAIFPDDGLEYPDETDPLVSGDAFFRFSTEWVDVPIDVALPEGRHWIRLTANSENEYLASVSTVSQGLPSFSRSGLGNDFFGQSPVALRILERETAADLQASQDPAVGELRLVSANPSRGPFAFELQLARAGRATLAIFDVHGRLVRTLLDRTASGVLHTQWDGTDVAGVEVERGVYFARLVGGGNGPRATKLLRLK